jgi:hypothetical protein
MPNPDECVKEVKAQQAKVRKKRALLADKGAPVSDADLAGAFGNNADTGGDIGRRGLEAAGGLIDLKTNTLSSDEIRKQLSGGKGGPKGPAVKIDTPVAGGGDNPAIDVENAMKVVKEGGGSIEACVNSAMKNNEEIPSKIGLVLSIQSNGVVDGAKLDNKVVQAADFGKCLTSAGKKWKFPPMTEAAELTVPLHLQ